MPRSELSRRLAVPTAVALLMLGVPLLWIATGHYRKFTQGQAVQEHVALAKAASSFVHELQKERGLSAGVAASHRDPSQEAHLKAQFPITDAAFTAYQKAARLAFGPDQENALAGQLGAIDAAFHRLSPFRDVVQHQAAKPLEIVGAYGQAITPLFEAMAKLSSFIDDAELVQHLLAYRALMIVKDTAGIERATGGAMIAAGQFEPDLHQIHVHAVARAAAQMSEFEAATGPHRARYAAYAAREADSRAIEEMRRAFRDLPLTRSLESLDAGEWWAKTTARIDRLKVLEDQFADDVSRRAADRLRTAWNGFVATIAIEFSGFAILSFLAFRYVRRTTAIIAAGEGRLQRQARQYESIVNQLQQIVMQVDGDGRIVFVNDAWERILGHSVEATIGQPAASFLESGIEFSGEEPAPNSSASPREAPYHEMRCLTADGHPRWLEINIGHDDGANQGDHVLVTLSDVTEKHQSRIRESAANHELSLRQYALDQAVILAVTNIDGTITYVNDKFCSISGYQRSELLGFDHRVVNSGAHSPVFFHDMYRTIARGAVWRGEICNRAKDGTLYWVDTTIIPRLDDRGKPAAYMAIRVDITARKAAEAARLTSERHAMRKSAQLEAILANMNQGLCMFDSDRRVVLCNEKYARMYGLPPDIIKEGMPVQEIVKLRVDRGLYAGSDPAIYLEDRAEPIFKASYEVEELNDGRAIAISRHPIPGGGWVTTHTDITERHRIEKQVAYAASHDTLTNLANRTLFTQDMKEALARLRQRGKGFAVYMLDLDKFKDINDSLGHPAGDNLLKQVAQRLRSCTRRSDTVARLGGDEFAIIQRTEQDQQKCVARLANRIIDAIGAPYDIDGNKVTIRASIGIALAPTDGGTVEELVKNADLALYRVKADGRNAFRLFETRMEIEARSRRVLESELRSAISQEQFELHYQPFVHAGTRQIAGFEALIRWRHPQRGLISPAEFIPIAEDTGVITELGAWVLRQACTDATHWPREIKVAVNLSPAQFKSGNLVETVADALLVSKLPPGRLELEITESVLLQETTENLEILKRLRSLGSRIVLDDFGIGFSSLSYLQKFSFDKIKIDKSFVEDISSKHCSMAIIKTITRLSRELNITTTAEGVEREEQATLLMAAGCNYMQGFHFARPRPQSALNFSDGIKFSDKLEAA